MSDNPRYSEMSDAMDDSNFEEVRYSMSTCQTATCTVTNSAFCLRAIGYITDLIINLI